MCETKDCPKEAKVFGLNGRTKIRSCDEHIPSLLSKVGHFFDMSGYYFISDLQDAAVFEERKSLVTKGRGNLSVLEASSEAELGEALKGIETMKGNVRKVVEIRFQEMKATATAAYTAAQQRLSGLRAEIDSLLTSRESQISPTARLLCSDLCVTPRLVKLGTVDVPDTISTLLSDCLTVADFDLHSTLMCLDPTQRKTTIQSALAEAKKWARKGIPEALRYADSLVGEDNLFEREKFEVVEELLKFEKCRIEGNLNLLKRSWDLRQPFEYPDAVVISVGQQLARLLYSQQGKYSEAEQMLKYTADIALRENPQSEVAMSLQNDLCGLYFASAQFPQLNALSSSVLHTFERENLPCEHYWTTLLYQTLSIQWGPSSSETFAVVNDWLARIPRDDSKLSEMLRLLIRGIEAYNREDREAEVCFQRARRIGMSNFPTSLFTAIALHLLCLQFHYLERKNPYYLQIQRICEVTAPKSVLAAENLFEMGNQHFHNKQLSKVAECYRNAKVGYETVGAKSLFAAERLVTLGSKHSDMKQWSDAGNCYQSAQAIFEGFEPKSIAVAEELINLGDLQSGLKQWSDAIKCYQAAQSTYEALEPKSVDIAVRLIDLSSKHSDMKQWDDVGKCYHSAQSILEAIEPKSIDIAERLIKIGNLLSGMKLYNEAGKCYKSVQSIFETLTPKSIEAAEGLIQLGRLHTEMRQLNDAGKCYQSAQAIFEAIEPLSVHSASRLNYIGVLLCDIKKWSEAEKCYRLAEAIYDANDPKSVDAAENYRNIGELFEATKKIAQAIEYYQKAMSIYTDRGIAFRVLEIEEKIASLQRTCEIS